MLRFRGFCDQQRIPGISFVTSSQWSQNPVYTGQLELLKPLKKVAAPSSRLYLGYRGFSVSAGGKQFADLPPYQPPQKGALSTLPTSWVPYAELMRIEKPGGLYGFYFPYLIGLGYAASMSQPVISPASLLCTGGLLLVWNVVLRGAACTINDNLDRDLDRQVARCRLRPIARGAVTPAQGHIFYAVETVVGAAIIIQLPHAADCFYHAVPILALVSLYPLAKRVTDFPQVVLSVPLAWGILMSCSALDVDVFTASGAVAGATSCLVASNMLWIIILDYVNACQDTTDDIKAGIRSMAVRYQNTTAFISVLGTLQVSLMVATGILADLSSTYFVVACGGNAILLALMAKSVNRKHHDVCAWWFLNGSLLVGGATVLGLFGEYLKNLVNENTLEEPAEKSEC